MSKDDGAKDGDYEVGYRKPPKHSRFVPGQSGFKGRKKKRLETQGEIIARVRDELVTINGKAVTKFELAIVSTINQTIKSGKPRDLKFLLDLLEKHGAMPDVDQQAITEAHANEAMAKISKFMDRTFNIDPADAAELKKLNAEEVQLVMGCESCSTQLRKRWSVPEYKTLRKRFGATKIHDQVLDLKGNHHANRDGKGR